jgi:anti-anti-sigma factor
MLRIDQRQENNITFLDIEGSFDIEAEDLIKDTITKSSSGSNGNFVFNFNEVETITSSGIGILLNAYMDVSKRGGIAKLSNVMPSILDAFQVHKVLPAFDIYPDEKSAAKRVHIELNEKGEKIRRLFERIIVDIQAKFKRFKKDVPAGMFRFKKADAKSLSIGGIFLQTYDTYDANTILVVKLLLPGGFLRKYVTFLGKVVWVAAKESHASIYPGMALSTLFIEEKEKNKLEDFIASQGV